MNVARRTPPPPPIPTMIDLAVHPGPEFAGVFDDPRQWERFALPGVDVALWRRAGDHPLIPRATEDYVFRTPLVEALAFAIFPHDGGDPSPVVLSGPPSAGKTSLVTELASRCNIPVFRVQMRTDTSPSKLFGRRVVGDQGGMVFMPGLVTRAMEEGGWLLLDELTMAPNGVLGGLFPVFEPHGEVPLDEAMPPRPVRRHPDFRVFVTDNTLGHAQEGARFDFAGTDAEVNAALLDRFHCFLQVDALTQGEEEQIMAKRYPQVMDLQVKLIVQLAHQIREAKDIRAEVGFRTLDRWFRAFVAGTLAADGSERGALIHEPSFDSVALRVYRSAERVFLNRIPAQVDRDAIAGLMQRALQLSPEAVGLKGKGGK